MRITRLLGAMAFVVALSSWASAQKDHSGLSCGSYCVKICAMKQIEADKTKCLSECPSNCAIFRGEKD